MRLGILGGMGPMATAVLYEKIINMTEASIDQEHLETIIFSVPQIPDRTAFILGRSEVDPYPMILETARKLEAQNVDAISIPCMTAAFFEKKLSEDINTPVFNGIKETAEFLASEGIKKAAILATEGSIKNCLIKNALDAAGIEAIIPNEEEQSHITSLIYEDVKTGGQPDLGKLQKVKKSVMQRGAEVCILGCTELSVIAHEYDIGKGYFDIMDMLSALSLKGCGKQMKQEYQYLIGE